MKRRQQTLRDHVADHSRYYAGIGLGIAILLTGTVGAIVMGWFSIAAFAAAALLVLFYFLAGSLITAQRKIRSPDHEFLYQLGGIQPAERVIIPYVRRRDAVMALSRYMTTGRIVGVDLYNPQLTPDPALARAGRRWLHPDKDPRVEWLDGSLDMLPLPDNSVEAALVLDTLGQFWQEGDRQRLLRELRRVLRPGGRLLLAERTRSLSNWLSLGPGASDLPEAAYWRELIQEARFEILHEVKRHDLTTCWRAQRPSTADEYQMAFNFGPARLDLPRS